MSEILINEIIKATSFVPGLNALSNVDFSQESKALDEAEWNKGVSLEETSQGTIVTISIFVSPDVRTKIIITELTSAIKNVFKKNKTKLNKVLVNVRGIK